MPIKANFRIVRAFFSLRRLFIGLKAMFRKESPAAKVARGHKEMSSPD